MLSEPEKYEYERLVKSKLGIADLTAKYQNCTKRHSQFIVNVIACPNAFKAVVRLSINKIEEQHVKYDVIVSQGEIGFIIGSAIAHKLRKPFVPLLDLENQRLEIFEDGQTVHQDFQAYNKYYISRSTIKQGASKVLIVDEKLQNYSKLQHIEQSLKHFSPKVKIEACFSVFDLEIGPEKKLKEKSMPVKLFGLFKIGSKDGMSYESSK